MKVLVSACLLGENCKYNGSNNYNKKVIEFIRGHEVIAVCPEVSGGLNVPRKPAEIVDGMIMTEDGISVSREFREGASLALRQALDEKIDMAILQSRSPSCGVNQIYDGTFSGKLIEGQGVFAEMLKTAGIKVIDVEDI
ncbi:DUF523 domain-containing protein [bacterium C-53]|nr:DUF523 domain-containing protein [Lachnospiraceae bacterium]NBI03259.1 DUF523 domain-containing protein [Lachnospiraceae bacterium]RKJ10140.1 DUF523 domain-containing protein [bacterium C-53]